MSRKFVVLACSNTALVLSTFVAICTMSLAQTNARNLPQPPSVELQRFEPFLGKYKVSGDYAKLPWVGTLELKTVIKGWYIEQIIQITSPGINREFWVLATWDKDSQKYRLWGFQTLPSQVEGDVRFEGDEMITEFTYPGPDGQKATSTNRYKFDGKDQLLVTSYRQIGNGSVEKIGTLRGKRMGAESVGSSDAVPAIQMRRLSDVVAGRWSGILTNEPGSHEGGHADETWRMSPGGLTVVEENHLSTPKRDSFDSAAVWWNRKAQKYQGIWCADINDEGCSGFDAQVDSNRVTMTGEWEQNGHRRAWREVFSRPDQNSSIQALDIGEPGGDLTPSSKIHAIKVSDQNVNSRDQLPPSPVRNSSSGPATPAGEVAAVREAMLALRSAELKYGGAAAADLLDDDFLLTTADGNLYNKPRFLRLVADTSNPLEVFEFNEMTVHLHDSTAVVSARLHEKGFMDGKPYELNARPTWTWVKRNNRWLCVAAHD